jgi:hypothetical protein
MVNERVVEGYVTKNGRAGYQVDRSGVAYRVKEVLVTDIPPHGRAKRQSKYKPLFDEVVLRLERTAYPAVIEMEFETAVIAKAVAQSFYRMATARFGRGVVRLDMRDNVLYIHWAKK